MNRVLTRSELHPDFFRTDHKMKSDLFFFKKIKFDISWLKSYIVQGVGKTII